MEMFLLFVLMFTCLSRVAYHVTAGAGSDFGLYANNHGIYSEKSAGIDNVYSRLFVDKEGLKNETKCNLFTGAWIHDASYPLYNAAECPYIGTTINCKPNGRPDSDYEKWRWQPDGCVIPRFDASDMLKRLRGKRLLFVGDSISRGQFQSMVCLLQAVIPSHKKSMVDNYYSTTFKALDYNASVEFFWAPFLVEVETDKQGKIILHLDSIKKYGMYWKAADILVFESSHWWDHHDRGSGQPWDVVMDGNQTYSHIDPMVAYRKALTTWANWTNSSIDFKKSKVFFKTKTPTHSRCEEETEPVQNTSAYNPPIPPQTPILKQVLSSIKFPVVLMDITRMSQLRKDGHPSVYGSPTSHPGDTGDCSHWCLPGVPDFWNELLYASLSIDKQ